MAATVSLLLFFLLPSHALCDDWPAYGHDIRRSNQTGEQLALPLHAVWRYTPAQPPRPAWPVTATVLHRMEFDYALQPVVANGILYFGSSADDTIRALDFASGREIWRATFGGPVRFAPQVYEKRLYASSDDGFIYCLDAASGKEIWRFCAAPDVDMFAVNDRFVSRWPSRTSVLVDNGVVYCTAGIFHTEGVYIYALDAASGKVVWCNDSSGFNVVGFTDWHIPGEAGHQGEFGSSGLTPHGVLAASAKTLLVPQGQNTALRFDRATGIINPINGDFAADEAERSRTLQAYGYPGSGGAYTHIDGKHYYEIAMHRNRKVLMNRGFVDTGVRGCIRERQSNLPQLNSAGPTRILAPGHVSFLVDRGRIFSRNAYQLILTGGGVLFQGGDGFVAASKTDDASELWRAPVDGKAYGLIVADGRLVVATDTGAIYCFSPQTAPLQQLSGAPRRVSQPAANPLHGKTAAILKAGRMDQGYAVIVGDPDAALAQALVRLTSLKVVACVPPARVDQLRGRLVAETDLYGSRLHVIGIADHTALPFAQYLANAVVVAGNVAGLNARELYRILRPCGGILLAAGMDQASASGFVKASGAPEGEITELDGCSAVVRGQLPGANDWNNLRADALVKWPLRPLWVGGPKSLDMTDSGGSEFFAEVPTVAFGRFYVQGENTITAVDAYNGTVLWQRSAPGSRWPARQFDGEYYSVIKAGAPPFKTDKHWATVWQRKLGADSDFVYLIMGDAYFRGQPGACIKIDAHTGEQREIFSPYIVPESLSIKQPQTWSIMINETNGGTIKMADSGSELVITLNTRDPLVTRRDAWELFFDFRPLERRYGLYEKETFGIRVIPAIKDTSPAEWLPFSGTDIPAPQISGHSTAGGSQMEIRYQWAALQQHFGGQAGSFGFAATLYSHNEPSGGQVYYNHLFGDHTASGLNNGWANIFREAAPPPQSDPARALPGLFNPQPKGWSARGAAYASLISSEVAQTLRRHPLTGEPQPKLYRSGTFGCGAPAFSGTAIFRRASKGLGIQDFADDSGLRDLASVYAPCGSSMIPALGLLVFAESRFRCDCNPPFRTSLAMAPAEKALAEDWAIYFDIDVDTRIRQAALNFGAFGDRRDTGGTLWLNFPRVSGRGLGYPLSPQIKRGSDAYTPDGVWMRHMSASINIPAELETFEGAATRRINADRAGITGSDRPWLYASLYQGIKKITMPLEFCKPLVFVKAGKAPIIDGNIEEEAWGEEAQARLPFTETDIFARHDNEFIYLAARRPPVTNRLGTVTPWTRKVTSKDGPVWNDDAFEVFLSDSQNTRVIHLGISASGARFDALATNTVAEDARWDASWQADVQAADDGFSMEMAIPWQTLREAGLDVKSVAVNLMINQKEASAQGLKYVGNEGMNWNARRDHTEALTSLGYRGRQRCLNFVRVGLDAPPPPVGRFFTVRLHFAELDKIKVGERVFDVRIQNSIVARDLDIMKAAGYRKALVREFTRIPATDKMEVEFIPHAGSAMPILNAFEMVEEGDWQSRLGAAGI